MTPEELSMALRRIASHLESQRSPSRDQALESIKGVLHRIASDTQDYIKTLEIYKKSIEKAITGEHGGGVGQHDFEIFRSGAGRDPGLHWERVLKEKYPGWEQADFDRLLEDLKAYIQANATRWVQARIEGAKKEAEITANRKMEWFM